MPEVAGALDRRLTVESPSETAGDAVVTWATDATVWGSLQFSSGANRNGIVAEAAYRLRVRYRADWATLFTVKKRLGLVGTTRKFSILSVGDAGGAKDLLEIVAQELV